MGAKKIEFGQKKIPVIDPTTGEEAYMIGNIVGDKLIVAVSDMIRFQLLGLTLSKYNTYLNHGLIDVLTSNGQPRMNRYDKPYLDLHSFARKELRHPERDHVIQKDKEVVYLDVD